MTKYVPDMSISWIPRINRGKSTSGFKCQQPLFLKFPIFYQMLRYGIVGLLHNLLGYVLYLFVTFFWLDPKVAITLFYPIGAVIAYVGHGKYVFSDKKMSAFTALRYALTYALGYLVNFLMLFVFVDKLHYPHQAIQALSIIVVAGFVFLLLKYFVFSTLQLKKAEQN